MMKSLVILLLLPAFVCGEVSSALKMPLRYNCPLSLKLQSYDNTTITDTRPFHIQNEHHTWNAEFNGGMWECTVDAAEIKNAYVDVTCRVRLNAGAVSQTAFCFEVDFFDWSTDNYVLLPGAVYNGNRFHSVEKQYPPLLSDSTFFRPDVPMTISNVPRLNTGGGASKIEQTTGDPATPAMGFFSPSQKTIFWILTEQQTRLGNSGLTITENERRDQCRFSITAPAMRERRQVMVGQVKSDDRAPDWHAGDEVILHVRLYFDRAEKIQDSFDQFVKIRKSLSGPTRLFQQLPWSAAFAIQQQKVNAQNWDNARGYYSVGMRENMAQDWQLGWVGGLMVTLPLLTLGDSLSQTRALQNIHTIITKTQAPSGFFYGIGDGTNWYSDGFTTPHPHNMHMVRKSADALYFLAKQFLLMEAKNQHWRCPDEWRSALVRLAETFIMLWNKYGQFGQFVDVKTGEMLVWGSSAGALVPGALALAAHYLKENRYLQVAEKAAIFYYNRDTQAGLTTGGPGEILQCPDSESAFAMLESFITLYLITGKAIYKQMAKDMAHQCAAWVVSYDYKFPEESLFGRLDMKSTGSVIANVQNKHSAPGICTLSGNSLFHLYRATDDTFYLDLLRDISHNITQYLSRSDRPVGDMPPGWMNERVNLSDWEGKDKVGEIFYGSTWAEVACMLTAAEIPGIYVVQDSWDVWIFDHIDVKVVKKRRGGIHLLLENPTTFHADYSIFVENSKDLSTGLSPVYYSNFYHLHLAPGEKKEVKISYKKIEVENQAKELPTPHYRDIRLPKKSSGYIAPGYYWIPGEEQLFAYSIDMFTQMSTLYQPSAAYFRAGGTFTAGMNAMISADKNDFGFMPLPYAALGPEFRLLRYIRFYPYMANIAFPFSLLFDSMMFYGGFDVGLRFPAFQHGSIDIHYGSKYFWLYSAGEWNETSINIKNITIGFSF